MVKKQLELGMGRQILDLDILAEFRATLGQAASAVWIEKFLQSLDFVSLEHDFGGADRDKAFETAHLVIARAGLIGCQCLVDACVELQRTCKSGADFLKPYADMSAAATEASVALRKLS
jgi:hypothetical protein